MAEGGFVNQHKILTGGPWGTVLHFDKGLLHTRTAIVRKLQLAITG